MLQKQNKRKVRAEGMTVAIVASEYNRRYVDGMLRAARVHLDEAGARVEVVRVPGAFEIPVAAAAVARREKGRPAAIVCLGVIWQGETDHAQHVGESVTWALMELQVATGIPCVHEVLTVRTEEQARARCLEGETNRGLEAARTAVLMAGVLERIRGRGR